MKLNFTKTRNKSRKFCVSRIELEFISEIREILGFDNSSETTSNKLGQLIFFSRVLLPMERQCAAHSARS